MDNDKLLTFPDASSMVLSIRAKALLFHDPRSAALIERVERIARSDATMLLIGETGTGKELIARHVHRTSDRTGPFIAVNCGAFSESLIDAELFGHEAGAFTGAAQARAGWFEAANGGTLFLDEIGDLPPPLQVKLLRVLQERQVVRLGSRRTIPLDVRLVAATNIDLKRAVEAQHFRADLYYRLSVAPVALPPLRERTGDILPLARHFIGVYGTRLGVPQATLSAEAEAALLAYCWPGNIRELENVIHFALIVCRDGIVRLDDLRLVAVGGPVRREEGAVATAAAAGTSVGGGNAAEGASAGHEAESAAGAGSAVPADGPPAPPSADDVLAPVFAGLLDEGVPQLHQRVEAALLRAAFERCDENQVRTARLLGVTRNTLRTLLKRHGLLAEGGRPVAAARGGAGLEAGRAAALLPH